MRKILIVVFAALLAAAVAIPALAGVTGAHFVGTPTISISGNTLTASGKVAGLGNVEAIHVTLTADVACINPGSNKPKASNKQSIGTGGDFPVQNGKAEFSLDATATFQPTCSGPMSLEWTNIVLTVTAPGVNLSITDPGPYFTTGS
jgi:hypothetical protein